MRVVTICLRGVPLIYDFSWAIALGALRPNRVRLARRARGYRAACEIFQKIRRPRRRREPSSA